MFSHKNNAAASLILTAFSLAMEGACGPAQIHPHMEGYDEVTLAQINDLPRTDTNAEIGAGPVRLPEITGSPAACFAAIQAHRTDYSVGGGNGMCMDRESGRPVLRVFMGRLFVPKQ